MKFRALFFVLLCACWLNPAAAQVNPQAVPITIAADNMTYDPDNNKVLFAGAVELVREDLTVWCETLTLNLKPSDNEQAEQQAEGLLERANLNPGDLESIVAENNVRFTMNTSSGRANKITYNINEGVLRMEGNPSLRDGDNSITGNVIRYYLAENRSVVEGGPNQRVQAIFGAPSL